MLENLSTKAIVTKARTMYGRRLKEKDYDELLRRTTVSEVAAYLKNYSRYSKILSSYNENTIHRGQLENLIRQEEFEMYTRLCNFEHLHGQNQFYDYILRRMEIEQILYRIMLLNANRSEEYITSLPSFLINRASFDLIELAKAQDYGELLDVLERTPYAKVLKDFEKPGDELIDYTNCEVALYAYYYDQLLKSVQKGFFGKVRKQLDYCIRMSIDLANITRVYRFRILFDEDEDYIKERLIPFRGSLKPKKLDTLISTDNIDDFFEHFSNISYSKKHDIKKNEFIERETHRVIYDTFKKLIIFSTDAPIVFYSLFKIFDIEVENLTNIIEGIRYGIPPDEIERLLIY